MAQALRLPVANRLRSALKEAGRITAATGFEITIAVPARMDTAGGSGKPRQGAVRGE
jgi:hypothetical protein